MFCAVKTFDFFFLRYTESDSLFDNEELMGIVQRNEKIKFKNFAYEIIRRAILKKNLSACWTIIKTISVASKLVRKIK